MTTNVKKVEKKLMKIAFPKLEKTNKIRKTMIRALGIDGKFHNLWDDGYGKLFYYTKTPSGAYKERIWIN